jgi:16S rRNA G966 N2-methylase RsmD
MEGNMSNINDEMKATANYATKSAKEKFGQQIDFSELSIARSENLFRKAYPSFLTGVLQRLRTNLRSEGLKMSVLKVYALIVDRLFDIRYGIDTCTPSKLAELTIDSDNKARAKMYWPTRVVALRKLFNVIKPMIPADSVFVDFGCGKGRVLLLASEFGFKEVRGVEFAHELCEIAKKNGAVYKARRGFSNECRIIECDATNYTINTDENVFFMFDPFDETILIKVLSNIAASLQRQRRKILIIYHRPKYDHIIEQGDDFTRLREFRFYSLQFVIYSNRD